MPTDRLPEVLFCKTRLLRCPWGLVDADDKELKKAFRSFRKYHPDKNDSRMLMRNSKNSRSICRALRYEREELRQIWTYSPELPFSPGGFKFNSNLDDILEEISSPTFSVAGEGELLKARAYAVVRHKFPRSSFERW